MATAHEILDSKLEKRISRSFSIVLFIVRMPSLKSELDDEEDEVTSFADCIVFFNDSISGMMSEIDAVPELIRFVISS